MPDPGELAKRLEQAVLAAPAPAQAGGAPSAAPVARTVDWPGLIAQVEAAGQMRVGQVMHDWVRVVSLEPAELRYSLVAGYPGDPSGELRDALFKATGERWLVEQVALEGASSLREKAEAMAEQKDAVLRRDPLVEAAMAAFPGAEFIEDQAAQRKRNRA
jgi:DNA polymerase-3 subunit gamma/tau